MGSRIEYQKTTELLSDIAHQLRVMNELKALDMCFKSGLISVKKYRKEMLKHVSFPLPDETDFEEIFQFVSKLKSDDAVELPVDVTR